LHSFLLSLCLHTHLCANNADLERAYRGIAQTIPELSRPTFPRRRAGPKWHGIKCSSSSQIALNRETSRAPLPEWGPFVPSGPCRWPELFRAPDQPLLANSNRQSHGTSVGLNCCLLSMILHAWRYLAAKLVKSLNPSCGRPPWQGADRRSHLAWLAHDDNLLVAKPPTRSRTHAIEGFDELAALQCSHGFSVQSVPLLGRKAVNASLSDIGHIKPLCIRIAYASLR